jgi:hypothetical protein
MALNNYSVSGNITCSFQPDDINGSTPAKTSHFINNLEVQLWIKRPLEALCLAETITDSNGNYTLLFSDVQYADENGILHNLFLLVYHKGILISQIPDSSNTNLVVDLIQ